MLLLEWSDTRVRFKVREVEDNLTSDLDLWEFTKYLLEIQFDDDTIKEFIWAVDVATNELIFDIFWEDTANKEWTVKYDVWGIKWAKKVRFNSETKKWKILNSVTIPDVLQESNTWTSSNNNLPSEP